MYLVTDEFLTTNSSITQLLPKYQEFYATFQEGILQIRTAHEQQSLDKSGVAETKNELRKLLVAQAADGSRKMQAYAKVENNLTLLKEVKFSISDLRLATDEDLETYARSIHSKIDTHLPNLSLYGLTSESQKYLLKLIADFKAATPTPRNSEISTKQSTDQIVKGFVTSDEALDKIDALVEIVRISQPDFYSGYKSARRIIVTGKGSLQVKGFVTDADTGEGLKGATLSFAQNSSNGLMKAAASSSTEAMKKKTAIKGGFNIKSLPEGTYTVTVRKNGYADVTTSIAVTSGELAKLNVELVKNI
jgi:hypothetical protein